MNAILLPVPACHNHPATGPTINAKERVFIFAAALTNKAKCVTDAQMAALVINRLLTQNLAVI